MNMKESKKRELLDNKLNALMARIIMLEDTVDHLKQTTNHIKEVDLDTIFYELPGHLQKTAFILKRHHIPMTATMVARFSKRARAVESSYLNVLAIKGVVKKERVSRTAYFTLLVKHDGTIRSNIPESKNIKQPATPLIQST